VCSYTVSSVITIETAWAIAGNPLTILSSQQGLDCDVQKYQDGCDGGDMRVNFDYFKKKGLMLDSAYPYTEKRSTCRYDSKKAVAYISGRKSATNKKNEDEMAANLMAYGPVNIGVASGSWQNYKGGIMGIKDCSALEKDNDHAVTIVGWDTDKNGQKYWIVRNQWGKDWGDKGYIYLKYGENACGLTMEATVVTIAKKYRKNTIKPKIN